MATKKTQEVVEIRPLDIQKVTIRVRGDTSLIMHKWSEKAKREMLDAQTGKKKAAKKEPKDPFADFKAAAYYITDEKRFPGSTAAAEEAKKAANYEEFCQACKKGVRFGFPVGSFKEAAISAAYRMGWTKDKMSLKGVFFIEEDSDKLVEIHSDLPVMREDTVRIGMGTADLRYRPEFKNWYTDLVISYNRNGAYSLDDIINIINAGGYVVGIGEWRVERDGMSGMFHVSTDQEDSNEES